MMVAKSKGFKGLQNEPRSRMTRESAGIVCLRLQAKQAVERGMREAVGRKNGGGDPGDGGSARGAMDDHELPAFAPVA